MIADGDHRREPDLTGMVQGKLPCLQSETLSEQLLDLGCSLIFCGLQALYIAYLSHLVWGPLFFLEKIELK